MLIVSALGLITKVNYFFKLILLKLFSYQLSKPLFPSKHVLKLKILHSAASIPHSRCASFIPSLLSLSLNTCKHRQPTSTVQTNNKQGVRMVRVLITIEQHWLQADRLIGYKMVEFCRNDFLLRVCNLSQWIKKHLVWVSRCSLLYVLAGSRCPLEWDNLVRVLLH